MPTEGCRDLVHAERPQRCSALGYGEKAATREVDAIAAQQRRLPIVELPDYALVGADRGGLVRRRLMFGEDYLSASLVTLERSVAG